MIKASKHKPFDRVFMRYNKSYLLRKHFHSVRLYGELDPDSNEPNQSVLYIMNHPSWWDGLLAYQAFRTFSSGDHYMMMDEKGLSQYPFFRWLGAYSIDRSSPQRMIASLRYSADLLRKGKRVWMFPQGEIYHQEQRPLQFKDGAAHLLKRHPETLLVPVSLYLSLSRYQKPEASLVAGLPLRERWDEWTKRDITAYLAGVLQAQLDDHRHKMTLGWPSQEELAIKELLRPGRMTSDYFDALKRRLGGWKSFFGR